MAKKAKKTVAKKKAGKRKAGQPTKYKPEYCGKIIAFFDVEPWETQKTEHYGEDGKVIRIEEGKRVYKRMPTIEGFARDISVCIHTVYNWVSPKHDSYQDEFFHAYNKAQTYRKNWLIDVGLSGLAPANSFKFVAVNCTDMTDKQDIDLGLNQDTITLLGLIDGSSKGKLPTKQEEEDAG